MLPISKDTLCMIGIFVCVIGIFYLYREMTKLKKMSVARPSQPVPMEHFMPHRVQTPVHDTPVQIPPPVPVAVPHVVPQSPPEGESKSD
jgi:hypothetical protein